MLNFLKTKCREIADDLADSPDYFLMDSHLYSLFLGLKPVILKYARGRCLDVGAGRLVYRPFFEKIKTEYVSLDIEKKHPDLDYQADAHQLPFKENQFETIFCSQVLEHTYDPEKVLKEISRVLKKEGRVIISVPHLSYLHNEPNDYYRFTKYGLTHLLKKAGLRPILIQPSGGVIALFGSIPSKFLLAPTYHLPFLGKFFFFLNKIFVKVIVFLDNYLGQSKLFPLNYIAVAEK